MEGRASAHFDLFPARLGCVACLAKIGAKGDVWATLITTYATLV